MALGQEQVRFRDVNSLPPADVILHRDAQQMTRADVEPATA